MNCNGNGGMLGCGEDCMLGVNTVVIAADGVAADVAGVAVAVAVAVIVAGTMYVATSGA